MNPDPANLLEKKPRKFRLGKMVGFIKSEHVLIGMVIGLLGGAAASGMAYASIRNKIELNASTLIKVTDLQETQGSLLIGLDKWRDTTEKTRWTEAKALEKEKESIQADSKLELRTQSLENAIKTTNTRLDSIVQKLDRIETRLTQ